MKKNNKKGFTLVELVIVVAVMAILVAIAIPTVSSITGKASKAVADTNAETIESIIKLAEAEAKVDNSGATLDNGKIAQALVDAKLGITSGTFYYNPTTGSVTTASVAGATEIKCTTTGVTVDTVTKAWTEVTGSTPAPSEESKTEEEKG